MGHTTPHVVEECLGILRVYSDGSIWREKPENVMLGGVPVLDIRIDDTVVFKDRNHDPHHGLSLRLYRPKSASPDCLLPVIFYIHGGGFCLGSCRWNLTHNSCLRLASALGAVVVSPDYRLAPEHRLPAAIDDVLGAVEWVRARAGGGDRWWSGVDFDRVFVVGDSSGGNLAHHLAVRLGMGSAVAAPVRTRGYILLSPFFGGVARGPPEEGPPDPILDLGGIDKLASRL